MECPLQAWPGCAVGTGLAPGGDLTHSAALRGAGGAFQCRPRVMRSPPTLLWKGGWWTPRLFVRLWVGGGSWLLAQPQAQLAARLAAVLSTACPADPDEQ